MTTTRNDFAMQSTCCRMCRCTNSGRLVSRARKNASVGLPLPAWSLVGALDTVSPPAPPLQGEPQVAQALPGDDRGVDAHPGLAHRPDTPKRAPLAATLRLGPG